MNNADKMPDFPALRQEAAEAFRAAHGWGGCAPVLLVDQASPRQYFRLEKNGKTVIFLNSPNPNAPQERLANVVAYAEILNSIGLRAPKVYAVDLENGFALQEDFGDDVYSSVFDTGVSKTPYLTKAMDALIHLHRNLDPDRMTGLGNDLDYFLWENPNFVDWYWPARNNYETPPDIRAEYLAIWKKLLTELPPLKKTMCMTDYHAPNLIDLKDGEGIQSVGIIDIQDSILATPVYDVMSLLEDDRRDLDDETGLALRKRYRDAMKDQIDPELFDLHFAMASAQRHAKNMGRFIDIGVTKRNPIWFGYIPQATKWFHRALHSHDYLAPMQKWFAKYCPDYNEPLTDIRMFKP